MWVWSQTVQGLSFSIEKWTSFCWMRGLDSMGTSHSQICHSIQSVLWALKLMPVISFDSQSKSKAEFIVHIFIDT